MVPPPTSTTTGDNVLLVIPKPTNPSHLPKCHRPTTSSRFANNSCLSIPTSPRPVNQQPARQKAQQLHLSLLRPTCLITLGPAHSRPISTFLLTPQSLQRHDGEWTAYGLRLACGPAAWGAARCSITGGHVSDAPHPRVPRPALTRLQQQQNEVTDIIIDETPAPMEVEEMPNVHDRKLAAHPEGSASLWVMLTEQQMRHSLPRQCQTWAWRLKTFRRRLGRLKTGASKQSECRAQSLAAVVTNGARLSDAQVANSCSGVSFYSPKATPTGSPMTWSRSTSTTRTQRQRPKAGMHVPSSVLPSPIPMTPLSTTAAVRSTQLGVLMPNACR